MHLSSFLKLRLDDVKNEKIKKLVRRDVLLKNIYILCFMPRVKQDQFKTNFKGVIYGEKNLNADKMYNFQ